MRCATRGVIGALQSPDDAGVDVGISVLEATHLTRLPTHHAIQVRTLLIGSAFVARVACGTLGLENLCARLG